MKDTKQRITEVLTTAPTSESSTVFTRTSPSHLLMIDSQQDITEELTLMTPEDFPTNYQDCAHPEDFVIRQGNPPPIEYVHHHNRSRHNRLICRVPWLLTTSTYFTISFIVDTGAPKHLYLSARAMTMLEQHDKLKNDVDTAITYVILNGRKAVIEETLHNHAPANLVGLPLLKRFELSLTETEPGFRFCNGMQWFSEGLLH